MPTEDHEPISEKDRQLIQMIINQPDLANAQIARLLGVSRQAVSERRKKLEDEGIIQNYVFWNIVPRLELTKEFEVLIGDVYDSQIEELVDYLLHNWKVAFVWSSSRRTISGIILTDQEKLFVKVLRDEFPFIRRVRLRRVEFKKFLGQRIVTKRRDERSLHEVAYKELARLSKRKSADTLLFSAEPKSATINIVVLRNKRSHRFDAMTFSDKIFNNTYVHTCYGTYEILKEMVNDKRKRNWIRALRIAFTRNKRQERRLKYLLRLARHI